MSLLAMGTRDIDARIMHAGYVEPKNKPELPTGRRQYAHFPLNMLDPNYVSNECTVHDSMVIEIPTAAIWHVSPQRCRILGHGL